MDLNVIASLVGSLGFPIVCCGFLGFYIFNRDKETNATLREIQKEHKEEIMKVTEVLQQNTLAIQKLTDRLDSIDDGR